MASDGGAAARALTRRLYSEPYAFEFAQAIALLERLHLGALPLGTGSDPAREAVRLSGPLTPHYPWHALETLAASVDGKAPPTLKTSFFGLGGPDGPLPYAYQEWLQQGLQRKDTATRDLLDVFHHRLLSLLYRAQQRYRLAAPLAKPGHGRLDQPLRALQGLRVGAPAAAEALRHAESATLFADQRRSLTGLAHRLQSLYQRPVRIRGYGGRWLTIAAAQRTRIGRRDCANRLGRDAAIGQRAWDEHAGFHLAIGPLGAARRDSLLPGTPGHRQLRERIDDFLGPGFDVRLSLYAVGPGAFQHRLLRQAPPHLGWSSRLAGATPTAEAAGAASWLTFTRLQAGGVEAGT